MEQGRAHGSLKRCPLTGHGCNISRNSAFMMRTSITPLLRVVPRHEITFCSIHHRALVIGKGTDQWNTITWQIVPIPEKLRHEDPWRYQADLENPLEILATVPGDSLQTLCLGTDKSTTLAASRQRWFGGTL
jgi:hypothetical protein